MGHKINMKNNRYTKSNQLCSSSFRNKTITGRIYKPQYTALLTGIKIMIATRTLTNTRGSKKLLFKEMPKNKEYPHTLDLRQRWIKK